MIKSKCMSWNLNCPSTLHLAGNQPVPEIDLPIEYEGLHFCSKKCCNDYFGEISEGTLVPYPSERGALTTEQVRENLSYFRYDSQD